MAIENGVMEIEACIKALKQEREALKAENRLLANDIKRIRALDAEKARIVQDVEERYDRLASTNFIATQRAMSIKKKAHRTEKAGRNEILAQELNVRPFVVLDDDKTSVILSNEHSKDHRVQELFEGYRKQAADLRAFSAAYGRLRQFLTEHLSLCDFVHKVKNIVTGPVEFHGGLGISIQDSSTDVDEFQQKTPPAKGRTGEYHRRTSLPVIRQNKREWFHEGLRKEDLHDNLSKDDLPKETQPKDRLSKESLPKQLIMKDNVHKEGLRKER